MRSSMVFPWKIGSLTNISERQGGARGKMHGDVSDRQLRRGVDMAKIPQGEWNAIAARYAKGESISKIAQSYRCTPPAIHYILKRSRQNAAENFEQPLNGRRDLPWAAQTPAASDRSRSTKP